MGESTPASAASPTARRPGVILRNALFLIASQAIVTPLSILITAVMARYLGPAEYGDLYLAGTFAGIGFLLVEWGQPALLTAKVARDHGRAAELLGSAIGFRLASALIVGGALLLLALALGKGAAFVVVLALLVIGSAMGSVINACQDVVRGFERMDFGAASYVGWQVLRLVVVVPTLVLGGRLHAVLIAQAACSGIGMVLVLRALPRVGVGPLRALRATARDLFIEGTPFLIFGLALALHANVDAVLMAKLASPASVGWYAAASKLQGALVFPAGVLIGALYPTLCRLYAEDRAEYRRTAASALRTTTVLVMPLALGCAIFPDVGIRLFSRQTFGPAEADLRVLAVYVLFVYFSMPISSCLMAGGRQRPWAAVQFACVLLSLALGWALVPRFQASHGNGGLGVCVSSVVSELIKVIAGVWLLPPGVFTLALLPRLGRAALAALAFAAIAWATHPLGSFVSAPLALAGYALCLWLAGGSGPHELAALRSLLRGSPPS